MKEETNIIVSIWTIAIAAVACVTTIVMQLIDVLSDTALYIGTAVAFVSLVVRFTCQMIYESTNPDERYW